MPALSAEEEKQRQKRERLEAWKRKKELEKKGKSATPEPSVLEKKPDVARSGTNGESASPIRAI